MLYLECQFSSFFLIAISELDTAGSTFSETCCWFAASKLKCEFSQVSVLATDYTRGLSREAIGIIFDFLPRCVNRSSNIKHIIRPINGGFLGYHAHEKVVSHWKPSCDSVLMNRAHRSYTNGANDGEARERVNFKIVYRLSPFLTGFTGPQCIDGSGNGICQCLPWNLSLDCT